MAGEIQKMLLLFCISSSFVIHSINSATTDILSGKEPDAINKTKQIILNKAIGHSALLQCDLLTNEMTDIIWYKNGTSLTNSSHHHISQSYQVLDNTRTFNSRSTLKISPLTADDSGSYSCKFNNTINGPIIFTLIVVPSNSIDLVLSGLFILGLISILILTIHVIKYLFTRRR